MLPAPPAGLAERGTGGLARLARCSRRALPSPRRRAASPWACSAAGSSRCRARPSRCDHGRWCWASTASTAVAERLAERGQLVGGRGVVGSAQSPASASRLGRLRSRPRLRRPSAPSSGRGRATTSSSARRCSPSAWRSSPRAAMTASSASTAVGSPSPSGLVGQRGAEPVGGCPGLLGRAAVVRRGGRGRRRGSARPPRRPRPAASTASADGSVAGSASTASRRLRRRRPRRAPRRATASAGSPSCGAQLGEPPLAGALAGAGPEELDGRASPRRRGAAPSRPPAVRG